MADVLMLIVTVGTVGLALGIDLVVLLSVAFSKLRKVGLYSEIGRKCGFTNL